MHSLRVLSASALLIPFVFSLHIAILLFGFSGLADRQVFMKALRSSPFMSFALSLQVFIFSCCGVILVSAAILVSALVSAANAGPQANMASRERVRIFFMGVSWEGFWGFAEGVSGRVYDTPIARGNDFGN